MPVIELLRVRRSDILNVAARHGARDVRVFGSVVRGQEREDSDVDFLVHMDDGRSLFDLTDLADELEALLQRRVDVISDGGLSPFLSGRILSEAVAL